MKNRVKKIFFGSVTRELLLAIILSVILLVIGVFISISVVSRKNDTVDNMLAATNSLYVSVNRYVVREDKGCEEYLKKLAKYYDLNAAITDLNGNVIFKSEKVYTDKIDLEKIRKILTGGNYKGGEFYQKYDVKLDNKECILIVWKIPKIEKEKSMDFVIFVALLPAVIVITFIYLLTRKKAEYIKKIYSGIKTISEGDLDYKIDLKGYDELSILAKEINNMSTNLKNKIEEERAAERLKSELITNVSHDLRTPLTSLIGYIQLAADDKTSSEDKDKYAKVSLEKAKKLKTLIDDLFEYSKLESGGIKLEKVKVNIIEIIEQSIGELSIQAKERYIGFNKNFENNKVELLVDPNKIGRVFQNIIGNAVKYSIEGSDIDIKSHQNNENIIISFENKIDGVSKENLEKVFDRFYRTDESRNSEIGGSGLGLAIAKSIVDLHGGKIWAEGENDRFIINIELFIR